MGREGRTTAARQRQVSCVQICPIRGGQICPGIGRFDPGGTQPALLSVEKALHWRGTEFVRPPLWLVLKDKTMAWAGGNSGSPAGDQTMGGQEYKP